jgi:hypothetical protein
LDAAQRVIDRHGFAGASIGLITAEGAIPKVPIGPAISIINASLDVSRSAAAVGGGPAVEAAMSAAARIAAAPVSHSKLLTQNIGGAFWNST